MAVAIYFDERTRAYHVGMQNALGSMSLLVTEDALPVDIGWEGGRRGFEGAHAQHALAVALAKWEHVDSVFQRMMK